MLHGAHLTLHLYKIALQVGNLAMQSLQLQMQ